ncbi:hypothetical protein [Massilia sp. ST3]|uniref:hypothetical protein n=1 Tax=Massilia sp. ST3 TaxID=2824903 RepID=UPI001B810BD7|nr:hypothetical protein [Massilia sp. ST3]MBQ5946918.1 hypothetical protein [Massilia sp. ST3]
MQAMGIASKRQKRIINPTSTAHAAFLLLFPGFFFYQTLLGIGAIPAFLGGYFTLVAVVLLLPLFFALMAEAKSHKHYITSLDLCLVLLALYYLFVLAANFAAGATLIIIERYVASIIFCFETYVIFRLIDFSDKNFVGIIVISLLVMSVITYYFSVGGFFFLQALGEAKDPASLATYQGFARSYIYTYLIVTALVRSMALRYVLYALATSALFLNGARSEFSAVLCLIPAIEMYYAKQRLYAIFALLLLSIFLVGGVDYIVTALPENRILQLLDLSHSSSAITRQRFTEDALRTIHANPFFGDFASYPDGHYAHNVLTTWVDFGLFGFVFFSALMLWHALWLFFNGFFSLRKSGDFVLAWSFVCATILWALTAKNMPDMSVGAALGAFARYRFKKNYPAKPGGSPV